MEIWDKGLFIPVDQDLEALGERQALRALKKGELKFMIKGEKLEGGFVLVRMKEGEKNWLLIKHKDEYAVSKKYDSEAVSKKKPVSKKKIARKSIKKKK